MATTLFSPISTKNRDLGFLSKSSFLMASLPFPSSCFSHHGKPTFSRRCFKSPRAKISDSDHVPKQFRQENLKEGLVDNFKNAPEYLYGLLPSQMNMFMTRDNPFRRLSEKVTKESISSANSYLNTPGMRTLKGQDKKSPEESKYSVYGGGTHAYGDAQRYGGEARRGRKVIHDLPTTLFMNRIVYLGLPITTNVTELIIAEFMYLDWRYGKSKPFFLYINCSGTQNENRETIGSETDAYAIADAMSFCKADIYTLNLGQASGQAGMLLSLGTKGARYVLPNSSTKLYLPNVYGSSGAATDMYIKAKELAANSTTYIELLAKGTGKSTEQLAKDISSPKYMQPLDTIEYGVADSIYEGAMNEFHLYDLQF